MGIVDVRFPTTYSGSKTDGSNIALLKLESSSSVAPISLAEVEDARHGPGIRIGLGKGTVRDFDAPFELQENGVVPRVNCEDVWNLKMLLSMSCVSARINETCKGKLKHVCWKQLWSCICNSDTLSQTRIGDHHDLGGKKTHVCECWFW